MSPGDLPDGAEVRLPGGRAEPGLSRIVEIPDLDMLGGKARRLLLLGPRIRIKITNLQEN